MPPGDGRRGAPALHRSLLSVLPEEKKQPSEDRGRHQRPGQLRQDPDLRALRAWSPTYRRKSWAQALVNHGINDPAFALLLSETFPRERRTRHVVYPDVVPALERVHTDHRLALLLQLVCLRPQGFQTPHAVLRQKRSLSHQNTASLDGARDPPTRVRLEVMDRQCVQPSLPSRTPHCLSQRVLAAPFDRIGQTQKIVLRVGP